MTQLYLVTFQAIFPVFHVSVIFSQAPLIIPGVRQLRAGRTPGNQMVVRSLVSRSNLCRPLTHWPRKRVLKQTRLVMTI